MALVARVILPLAAPAAYLAWMAYGAEVSAAFRSRPSVAALAVPLAPPTEETLAAAEWLAQQVVRQAEAAQRAGEHVFSPTLESDPITLSRISVYFERRAEWLDHHLANPRIAEALGVERLEPDLASLRDRSFQLIRAAWAREWPPAATE